MPAADDPLFRIFAKPHVLGYKPVLDPSTLGMDAAEAISDKPEAPIATEERGGLDVRVEGRGHLAKRARFASRGTASSSRGTALIFCDQIRIHAIGIGRSSGGNPSVCGGRGQTTHTNGIANEGGMPQSGSVRGATLEVPIRMRAPNHGSWFH